MSGSQDLTTTGLITTVRLLASVPNNQQLTSDDASILDLLNFEMNNALVPQLMAVREEYFVEDYDFNNYCLPTGIWQDRYELPANAIGMKLRDFVQLTTNGAQLPPIERFIPRISPEDVASNSFGSSSTSSGTLSFYMKVNNVILYPCPTQVIALRMKYFKNPNYLVSTSEAGQILSIDPIANTVVLSNLPSTWSTGNTVDIIQNYQGFEFDAENVTITSISNPTLGLTTVANLEVGSWVALSGNSPIPQLPTCAHAVLAQAVVVKLLESLKDVAGVQLAQQKYNELFKAMEFLITPRVEGEVVRITSGGRGLKDYLRGNRGWGGYRN